MFGHDLCTKALKITVDQMKNYLNTGLHCLLDYDEESYFDELVGIHKDGELRFAGDQGDTHTIESVKPECYRMSDLDKFIPALGFIPIEEVDKHHNFSVLRKSDLQTDPTRYPFTVLQALFQWNFWVFDQEYFTQGLVIDKLRKEASDV